MVAEELANLLLQRGRRVLADLLPELVKLGAILVAHRVQGQDDDSQRGGLFLDLESGVVTDDVVHDGDVGEGPLLPQFLGDEGIEHLEGEEDGEEDGVDFHLGRESLFAWL